MTAASNFGLWTTEGTGPTLVGASPTAVRTPTSIGALPDAVGTPSAIIVVRRTMRGNPFASPPAPMAGYRMPTPTTTTPRLDDARRWNKLLYAGPKRGCVSL